MTHAPSDATKRMARTLGARFVPKGQTIPTPEEMVEELEGAAHDLRACANKKKDAVESLTGFSLDAIAIYTGNAADLIQQQLATIERLSAALEDCRDVLRDVPAPHWVALWSRILAAIRNADAALGKDASDVRSQREGRGQ